MSKIYKLDFYRLAVLLLPTFLRKGKMIAWLKVLITPIVSLQYKFQRKRKDDIYKLNHNGQVCYLRKVLNDRFDKEKRRIKIVDGIRYHPKYIYTRAEKKPRFLGRMNLYDESVYNYNGVDFYVLIPIDIFNKHKTEIEIGKYRFYDIEGEINYYCLVGKKYKIEIL